MRGSAAVGAVVAAALLLGACGSSDAKGGDATTTTKARATTTDPKATTTTSGDVDDLHGAFVSSEVTGYDLAPDSELTFTFDGGTLSVNAGCNTMSSGFSIDDRVLAWTGAPAATMMACDEAHTAQDAWITGLLTKGMA
ncbi:MAG TPA: META domain-containing protein, partial [Acidimicrobiales bacterium]|nr:META domain-containing protein [Acidimicrobiales bacterium]